MASSRTVKPNRKFEAIDLIRKRKRGKILLNLEKSNLKSELVVFVMTAKLRSKSSIILIENLLLQTALYKNSHDLSILQHVIELKFNSEAKHKNNN